MARSREDREPPRGPPLLHQVRNQTPRPEPEICTRHGDKLDPAGMNPTPPRLRFGVRSQPLYLLRHPDRTGAQQLERVRSGNQKTGNRQPPPAARKLLEEEVSRVAQLDRQTRLWSGVLRSHARSDGRHDSRHRRAHPCVGEVSRMGKLQRLCVPRTPRQPTPHTTGLRPRPRAPRGRPADRMDRRRTREKFSRIHRRRYPRQKLS